MAGLLCPAVSQAAESGVGFYLLGSRGPAAGVVPPPGTYFQNDLYFYSGTASASREFEFGGNLIANVDADAIVNLTSILWSTPTEVLGGNLAFSLTIPIGYQDVSANLEPTNLRTSDNVFTYGDPVLGSQIAWHSGNLHYTVGTLINVPIGDYQSGEIANVAFNRWGMDVFTGISYIDANTGWDFSANVGVTFNGENNDTNYKTGDEFHFEWAVSKAFSPTFSAGLTGYYYEQISGDSGDGANLGPFKGRVAAVGLTAAYNFQMGQRPASLRVKYFDEFNVKNRLEGEAVFVTLAFPL